MSTEKNSLQSTGTKSEPVSNRERKFSREQAIPIVNCMIDWLSSCTVAAAPAGAMRRFGDWITSVDIVTVPNDYHVREIRNLFKEVTQSMPTSTLMDRARDAYFGRDNTWAAPDDKSDRTLTAKTIVLRHRNTGLLFDIHLADKRTFAYWMLVWTGPAEFNKAIMTLALERGYFFQDGLLHGHPRPITYVCQDREECPYILDCYDDNDIFKHLDYPYQLPSKRDGDKAWQFIRAVREGLDG